ncbi:MAG: MBL fold metallo-hydrolase, partial [Firmicutes bacterium]|nr:MBL fold metallo-hydrolase [Bacillota bacterium]
DCDEITSEGMRIDKPLKEGETIDLGDISVQFFEAKGHTDCSALYMVLPMKILFANESMAQIKGPGEIGTSPLKSFNQTIESARKAAALKADTIISMHYGVLPREYNQQYFLDYIDEAQWERDMILRGIRNGLSDQEISDIHDKFYWNEDRALNQPYDAYHLNTMIIIARVRKAVEEGRTDY